MKSISICTAGFLTFVTIGVISAQAARGPRKADVPTVQLTEHGKKLEAKYSDMLADLKAEISKSLPTPDAALLAARSKARETAQAAQAKFGASGNEADRVKELKTAMGLWQKFGIKQAEQGAEKANAALKAATSDAQRESAQKELDKWQKHKVPFEKKISDAEIELAKLAPLVADSAKAKAEAKAALDKALAAEDAAARALVTSVDSFLADERLDAKVVKGALLAWATPTALAKFAEQSPEKETLVDQLLNDDKMMREMLEGGGAMFGKFGQAMEIYSKICKASTKAKEGMFRRLALGVSLELAEPIEQESDLHMPEKLEQSHPELVAKEAAKPKTVDPVQRYLSYEKAWLDGMLDPAFQSFSPWEYRMVINCVASNEMLAWGREMIRNYRPDLVTTKKNGWSYSGLVKSDVGYGSAKCKNDRPELSAYQNILNNGGICGRRASFGRFILRANGIPVWGATQHKHAALSRWTPKGWVVNLGAGFHMSWWDKGDVSMSGTDFLLETQARRHPQDFSKVQRAQWISRSMGEEQYNGRRNRAGGNWSAIGNDLMKLIAKNETDLGALGEELAEANAPQGTEEAEQGIVTTDHKQVKVSSDGVIAIPAVAFTKSSGTAAVMDSLGKEKGVQLLASAGFKGEYEFTVPQSGKYTLSAKVVTVHEGHRISLSSNNTNPVEIGVPYTVGLWRHTDPVEFTLNEGLNTFQLEILGGGKIAIKEFILKPMKRK